MSGGGLAQTVARARAFVAAHGDAAAQARCAALADATRRADAAAQLGPVETPEQASVALGRLVALGVASGPAIERCVERLSA
ncbi:MAG: hypothetical protein DCC71_22300, partial [Proteobacteria bacterium]